MRWCLIRFSRVRRRNTRFSSRSEAFEQNKKDASDAAANLKTPCREFFRPDKKPLEMTRAPLADVRQLLSTDFYTFMLQILNYVHQAQSVFSLQGPTRFSLREKSFSFSLNFESRRRRLSFGTLSFYERKIRFAFDKIGQVLRGLFNY
jgi:hypothetical protein